MTLTFQINYRAQWGESLCIVESEPSVLGWTEQSPLALTCQGSDFWTVSIPLSDFVESLTYKYALRRTDGSLCYEDGDERHLVLRHAATGRMVVRDFWQRDDYEKAFRSTAFQKALFLRQNPRKLRENAVGNIYFTLDAPQVLPTQGVAIVGNIPELGAWDIDNKVPMTDSLFPKWETVIKVKEEQVIEYKYVIYELSSGNVVDIEWGENRQIWGMQKDMTIFQNDRSLRRTQPRWKGAGVAVPVFSLRTDEGFGIGEFQDLKKLADWAALTGQRMIQTLPINDTTLRHNNLDSYPYNAVSVFALHPIYLNIEKMGKLSVPLRHQYEKEKAEFNKKPISDYQAVYDAKMKYMLAIFRSEHEAVFATDEYKAFFEKNKEWLVPYAVFCYLRDKFGTPHFADWKRYSEFNEQDMLRLASPPGREYV